MYVVAGQSNAVRIFSTGAFESVLNSRGAGELGIVSAENGESLYPSQTYNDYYPFDDGDANTGELYRDLVDSINAELSADSEVYLAGVFWLQGEEDASSATYGPDYYDNLHELYDSLADEFGGGFDFVISELSSNISGAYISPAWSDVQDAQEQLASEYAQVQLINPDDLITEEGYTPSEVFDDEYHYTQIAYEWLADAFFDLFPLGGNTAPDAVLDGVTTAEDTELTGNVLADNGDGADSDPDGDTLTVDTTPVVDVSNGTLVLNANGAFTYTPDADFVGSDTFTYEISDGNGGTDRAKVTVDVTAVNDDPVAAADTGFTTPYGASLDIDTGDLTANDDDGDPELDQTLTVIAVGGAVNGTVSLTDGVVTFTPTSGYSGSAQFSYEVSDGAGGTDTAVVSLSVGANQAPTAAADTVWLDEDTRVTGNVLDNDSDPEGHTLTGALVSGPAEGVLSFEADGSFAYEADADLFDLAAPGEVIEQSFTYEISDGHGGSDEATVALFVNILDDGEDLVADSSGPVSLTGTDGGEDHIVGSSDDDTLYGLDGADTIEGGGGDDHIYGGASVDELSGGRGSDWIDGGDGGDFIKGGNGDDTLSGGSGADYLNGGDGDDIVMGRSGSDGIRGGKGDDELRGGADNDWIKGAAGADLLKGGTGDDWLYGGAADDTLKGGSGSDSFVFAFGRGEDRVLDFTQGEDMLVLKGLDYTDVTIGQSGDDATISAYGDIIAVLDHVDASLITVHDFLS